MRGLRSLGFGKTFFDFFALFFLARKSRKNYRIPKELSKKLEICDFMEDKLLKLKETIREDWTVLPFLTLTMLGFIAAILDFVYSQNFNFKTFAAVGLLLLLVGGLIRMKARLELKKKARFGSLIGTGKLQIVKEHRLVKDGLYKHIRHPLYLGEILRNLGFAVIFSSVYGTLIVLLASIFLLFRIELEEKMLIAVFGEEYKEYKRKTKRLIPYLF